MGTICVKEQVPDDRQKREKRSAYKAGKKEQSQEDHEEPADQISLERRGDQTQREVYRQDSDLQERRLDSNGIGSTGRLATQGVSEHQRRGAVKHMSEANNVPSCRIIQVGLCIKKLRAHLKMSEKQFDKALGNKKLFIVVFNVDKVFFKSQVRSIQEMGCQNYNKKTGAALMWNQFILHQDADGGWPELFVTLFDEARPKREIVSQEINLDLNVSHDLTSTAKSKKNKNVDFSQLFFLSKNIEVHDYPIETYVECGMKVDLTYAIDLTISNGDYRRPTDRSLHRMIPRHDGMPENVYSRIMTELVSKLDGYMKSGTYSDIFGFGAKTNRDIEANQCFDFGNRSVGTAGAIHAYAHGLQHVQLSGPAHFSKVIEHVNNKQVLHDFVYKACVIITDGEPQDIQDTIDQLVISSFKPVSFIVISVSLKIEDQMHHEHLMSNFDQIEKLAMNIQHSERFQCYQARQNLIYTHCGKSIEDIGSEVRFIDVEAISNKLFDQMKEYYKLNKIDPYKNRKISVRCKTQQSSPTSLTGGFGLQVDSPRKDKINTYEACFQEGIDQHCSQTQPMISENKAPEQQLVYPLLAPPHGQIEYSLVESVKAEKNQKLDQTYEYELME